MIFGFTLFDIGVLVVSMLVAMTVHEAMHAYVGLLLGDTTAAEQGRVSLNPLRHIDPFMTVALPIITLVVFQAPVLAARPVPFNPTRVRFDEFGAALIALAGPVSNLVLAAIAALLLRVAGVSGAIAEALYLFVSLNIALFVFNMIPIPPLDGSRVLYAFAPEPVQQFMRQLEQVGLILVFGLAFLGGFAGVLTTINETILRVLLGW
ncbi:MAG TPA: site-2 protease family protein [Candidatus Saccharimonadales bacterium]|nr:site-2 protease family protein [Candidatus Saccharimonadales bacterium]